MARPKRCWYCGIPLDPRPNRPDSRTTEHLISRANGGIDHRKNLRLACGQCNSFVGSWPLEDKLKFRQLARQFDGWPGLRQRFGPKRGRSWRVRCQLARMDSPRDAVSMRAREALYVHRRPRPPDPEPDPAPEPGRVLVDATPYLESGGIGPAEHQVAQWRFRIGEERWSVAGQKEYHRARRKAVARAVKAGVRVIEVLAPK